MRVRLSLRYLCRDRADSFSGEPIPKPRFRFCALLAVSMAGATLTNADQHVRSSGVAARALAEKKFVDPAKIPGDLDPP